MQIKVVSRITSHMVPSFVGQWDDLMNNLDLKARGGEESIIMSGTAKRDSFASLDASSQRQRQTRPSLG